jgi:hypothetical protein
LTKYTELPSGQPGVISWYYNWRAYAPDDADTVAIEYVPMVWGEEFLEEAIANGWTAPPNSKHLLGFNEPDIPEQANMTPERAATLWPKIEALARSKQPRLLIGSPAVVDLEWLDSFLSLCEGCVVDFLAFHAYTATGAAFIERVRAFHTRFPDWSIWITEMGYGYTQDPTNSLKAYQMEVESTQFLDAQDYVQRYSWFGMCDGPGSETTYGIGPACADTDTTTGAFTPLALDFYFTGCQ